MRLPFPRSSPSRITKSRLMSSGADSVAALLVFGTGYVGMQVARRAIDLGFEVYGTANSTEQLEHLFTHGIEPVLFDGRNSIAATGDTPFLPHITHMLSTLPPDRGRDPVLTAHPELVSIFPALRWAGYLSSVDVYGSNSSGWVDASSGWMDEETVAEPVTQLGHVRRLCEDDWSALAPPTHIFRTGQVYGPNSGALAAVRAETAVRILREGYVRPCVHVDDVVQLVTHAMRAPSAPAPGDEAPPKLTLYNLVDQQPSAPSEELAFAAELLGMAAPTEVAYDDIAGEYDLTYMYVYIYIKRERERERGYCIKK